MTLSKTKIGLILTVKKGHKLDFIKKVWQLTTLKISPEVLPYERVYLLAGLALNFFLSYLIAIFLPPSEIKLVLTPVVAILMKATNLFCLALFLYLILKFTKKSDRFFKLYTAIVVGTLLIEAINFCISLLPSLLKQGFGIELSTHLGLALMFTVMVYITIVWMIVFMGHIFRYGLDVSRLKGIWIGIAYMLISVLFSAMIFGNPFEEIIKP